MLDFLFEIIIRIKRFGIIWRGGGHVDL